MSNTEKKLILKELLATCKNEVERIQVLRVYYGLNKNAPLATQVKK